MAVCCLCSCLLLIWLFRLSQFFMFWFYFVLLYIWLYVLCAAVNCVNCVFLLLCVFRSVYSVSLSCSVYCLCVNVYCTAATGCHPIAVNKYIIYLNIYHITYVLNPRSVVPACRILCSCSFPSTLPLQTPCQVTTTTHCAVFFISSPAVKL
jgi:hypothetical protein